MSADPTTEGTTRRPYPGHWEADVVLRDGGTAHVRPISPDDAELLRMWAWEQLTPAELATVLAITPNAASIRLHRAREKLRAALGKISGSSGHEESRDGRTS